MKLSFISGLCLLLSISLSFSSCKKQSGELQSPEDALSGALVQRSEQVAVPDGEPLSKQEVDRIVLSILERNGDFRWEMTDFKVLWSAIQYGDQSVAIGYQPANAGDISQSLYKIDISKGAWKEVHDQIIELVLSGLAASGRAAAAEEIILEDDPVLPIITFRLNDKRVLTELRNLQNVRYIEALDYWPFAEEDRSTSGCSVSTYALNTADYSTTTPNALLPWNFANNTIPASWNNAQGLGIKIGVIDAGISSSQSLIGSDFNAGESNVGRTMTTDYTFGTSAYSTCSHGTAMSGLAVGPRNGYGATTGVAYKSSLHFIRGCEDVVLDKSSERTGVKNALVKMGQKPEVKIVSMSVGTPFYSSVLEDGVNYAYGAGKMLMAAAGTSFSWTTWWGVVYPAALNNCVAITGVKENFSACASCHTGSQVDFTITMERNTNSSRNSLSLAPSGYAAKYIGGSSAATAIAAGIAANVWSVNPNFTREQVYNFLLTTSQYYPNPSGSTGYGNLNASAAVNAAMAAI